MKTRSASSRSAGRATTKKRDTSTRADAPPAASITAAEFDRLADLPPDDPAGDLEPHMDWEKAVRPGRAIQRVNVDFPIDLLRAIDQEATRIGVTRQAFIKLRLADTLPTAFIKLRLADTLPTRAVAVVGQGATMLEAVRTFVEQQAVDETTVAVLGRPTMAENVMEAFRMFFEQQAVDETTRKASDVPSPAPRAKVNRAPRAHSIVER